MRAVGEHIKFKKPQREKVHRERLRLFMRKGGWISIRKWKMIHRLQFELTLIKISIVGRLKTCPYDHGILSYYIHRTYVIVFEDS